MKLNQKIIDASSKLMDTLTKRYYWYHDTPEQPFEYTEGSIWLINSETGQWMLVLEKPGFLWYYNGITDTFFKYLNMKYPDFDSFIKIWVEDNLQREVKNMKSDNKGLTEGKEKRNIKTNIPDKKQSPPPPPPKPKN